VTCHQLGVFLNFGQAYLNDDVIICQKGQNNNWEVGDWIDLVHDRGGWRALLINLMTFLNFKKNVGNY
jgi:hypothetical protein